jgi:hypothetical protein
MLKRAKYHHTQRHPYHVNMTRRQYGVVERTGRAKATRVKMAWLATRTLTIVKIVKIVPNPTNPLFLQKANAGRSDIQHFFRFFRPGIFLAENLGFSVGPRLLAQKGEAHRGGLSGLVSSLTFTDQWTNELLSILRTIPKRLDPLWAPLF